MREYAPLLLIIATIFVLTLAGAYFSDTFTQYKSFMELLMVLGSLLFIFSVLAVLVIIGFRTFALFLAVFAAVTMVVLGLKATMIMIVATYIVWGFIFSIELLLLQNGAPSALEWFKSHYTYPTFRAEFYAFLPILIVMHVLLEIIPYFLLKESLVEFSPRKILAYMKEFLRD